MIRGFVVGLGNEGLDAGFEGFGAAVVGADDEDGVVAGEGADDFGPLFVVEGGGDGLGAADGGEDDEEVLGLANLEAEVLKDVADFGQLFGFFVDRGEFVAGGAFEELELADVARERGLGDVDAAGGELAAEVVLVIDSGRAVGGGGLGQEVPDRVLALVFH